jgi:hypothetical protein
MINLPSPSNDVASRPIRFASGAVGPTVFQLQMAILFPDYIGAAVASSKFIRSKIIA